METRFATPGDIPELIRLRFNFFDTDPRLAVSGPQKAFMTAQLQSYYEKHLNQDFFAALAEADGHIAAVAFLVIHEKPANYRFPTGKIGEILNVFTYTPYRFNGFATATLKLLIDKAKQADASLIELSATSAGKPVYEKFGFEAAAPNPCTDMMLKLL